jgi:hypothetical protein
VGGGTVGLAWDALAAALGAVDPPGAADALARADALAPTEALARADELAPAEALGPAVALGPVLGVAAVALGLGLADGLAVGIGPPAEAGAPHARNVPLTATTPSMATVVSSEKAVDLTQVLPSVDDHEDARPGAVSLVSVPTATMRPLAPAIPRASKPSSEVVALAQSRPLGEYQAAEPLLRTGPVPFQRPTITKPPSHALTALSV